MKQRLDVVMLSRQLVESREKAQALILSGKVTVDGQKAQKPGHSVSDNARIEIAEPLRYVSRGGLKLEAALEQFAIDPTAQICLDVGTSTGGFTDCLLQRGALRVHAADTGAGQIDWKLRTDPRVVLHENLNARYLTQSELGEKVQLIACDVSFISVTLLIPALAPLLTPDGNWIILIKPQFEVGRELVGKGGIVRDPSAHQLARDRVVQAMAAAGFTARIIDSPILGVKGNREFLLHGAHSKP
jgi:23S rRNA (cytidine1920-2'-O)/16S rRNA (cytidine1409-2'-O)-methyltransferase